MSRLIFLLVPMLSLARADQDCQGDGCPVKVNSLLQSHSKAQIEVKSARRRTCNENWQHPYTGKTCSTVTCRYDYYGEFDSCSKCGQCKSSLAETDAQPANSADEENAVEEVKSARRRRRTCNENWQHPYTGKTCATVTCRYDYYGEFDSCSKCGQCKSSLAETDAQPANSADEENAVEEVKSARRRRMCNENWQHPYTGKTCATVTCNYDYYGEYDSCSKCGQCKSSLAEMDAQPSWFLNIADGAKAAVGDLMERIGREKDALIETATRIADDAEACLGDAGDDLNAKYLCAQTAKNDLVVLIPTSENVETICEDVAAKGWETTAEECQKSADKMRVAEDQITTSIEAVEKVVEEAIEIVEAAQKIKEAVEGIHANALACADAAQNIGETMVCLETALADLAPFVPTKEDILATCMKAASFAKDQAAAEDKCREVSKTLDTIEKKASATMEAGQEVLEYAKNTKVEIGNIQATCQACKEAAGDDVALKLACVQSAAQSAAKLIPPVEQIVERCNNYAAAMGGDGSRCAKIGNVLTDMGNALEAIKQKLADIGAAFKEAHKNLVDWFAGLR